MNFRSIFILIIALQAPLVWSQDSISIAVKNRDYFNPIRSFYNELDRNPAIKGFSSAYSRSELGGLMSREKNTFQLQQLGEGIDQFGVSAQSFYRLDTVASVWGTADYRNGTRKNVQWNESSDYDKIYPFVTADSVGGDLSMEIYGFKGGYAFKSGKYRFGVTAAFKALMEYRSVDPRPNNISSDLNLNLGASRLLTDSYRLGVDFSVEKYTQTNEIAFFSELGNPALYHMSGLGNFNNLLYGTRKKSLYEGWGYAAAIQWYNERQPGWFFQTRWKNFELEKSIADGQAFVSSTIKENDFNFTAGKIYQIEHNTWAIQVGYQNKLRKGIENILSNGALSSMLIIGSVENYNDLQQKFLVEGLFAINQQNWNLGFAPFVTRNTKVEKHLLTKSEMSINDWTYGLKTTWSKMLKNNSIWHVFPSISYRKVDKASNHLLAIAGQKQINQMLQQNFEQLSAALFQADLRARYDFKLKQNLNVFWEASINYQCYKSNQNTYFQTALGITF